MRKGVSLIEVLVTSLILTMGVSSLLYSYVVCHRMIIDNANRQQAMFIINEHLEAIQNREVPAEVLNYVAAYNAPQKVYNTYNNSMTQDYWVSMKIESYVNPAIGSNLAIVTATVTWNGGGPNNTMSVSAITNQPEV